MFWKRLKYRKNGYKKPDMEIIALESENGFLKGSIVETKIIDFNIESKPYEVEEDAWYGNSPTFE